MIARHVAIAAAVYGAVVVQTNPILNSVLRPMNPWLPGIVLATCLLRCDRLTCLTWSAILGLAIDCLTTERLGIDFTIAVLITGIGLVCFRDDRPEGFLPKGLAVFCVTLIWQICRSLVHGLGRHPSLDVGELVLASGGVALVTTLLASIPLQIHQILRYANRSRTPASALSLNNRWTMLTR